MNVLIIGGAGMIGSALASQLLSRGGINVSIYDLPEKIFVMKKFIGGVSWIEGSILEYTKLRDACRRKDAVFHLAAMLGVGRTESDPLGCLEINYMGTKNVLDAAMNRSVKKFIFASSSEVYGVPLENPIDENARLDARTVYATSKLAGEHLVRGYHKTGEAMTYTIVRFFNTYGPYQVAKFAVSKFILDAHRDRKIIINGSGQQSRSYCFSSDIAEGLIKILHSESADNQILNLGNPDARITLNELCQKIISKLSFEVSIVHTDQGSMVDRSADREIYTRYCNIDKARKLLGFNPTIDIDVGLNQIIDGGRLFEKWHI